MVTYRYLERKFIKPLEDKLRTEGAAAIQRQWEEWNSRREAAESRGEPFDEPPPRQRAAGRRRSGKGVMPTRLCSNRTGY